MAPATTVRGREWVGRSLWPPAGAHTLHAVLLRRGLLGLLLGALVLALAPGIAGAAPGDPTPTTIEIGEPLYIENPDNPPVTTTPPPAATRVLGARYERAPRGRALARTGAPLEALALAGAGLVAAGELCRRRGAATGSAATPRG